MQTTVNGIRLQYEVIGKGAPVLMVHGWNGSMESMKPLAKLLSKGNQVYIVDLPGFGGSSCPPENWEAQDYVDTIYEFIKKHDGLIGLTYVGHSFGGGIGMKLSYDHPAAMKNLVLICAAYHRDPKVSGSIRTMQKLIPFYGALKEKFGFSRRAYYKIFHPGVDTHKKPELEKVFRRIIKEDLRDIVPKITTRTLVLWGREDQQTPVADAYYLEQNMLDVRLKIFDLYSHNLPIVAPEKLIGEINEFILKTKS